MFDTRIQSDARTAVAALLLAAASALPLHGQTLAPIGLTLDGGVIGAGAAAGLRAPAVPAHVTWFGGLTARTARARLGRAWDFSAEAALRREPAFAMARTASGVAPAYLDALTASASIAFAHRSGAFETAVVGRFAETRLDREQRVPRAANTINDWAFLVDAVTEVRWYGTVAAAERDADRSWSSIVRAYAGVQHNQRLHRAGDLQPFDDPTGRIVGGFFVTPWRRRNASGEPVFAAGAGVDFETAIRSGERLPAGFRALVRAEIDLRHTWTAWR